MMEDCNAGFGGIEQLWTLLSQAAEKKEEKIKEILFDRLKKHIGTKHKNQVFAQLNLYYRFDRLSEEQEEFYERKIKKYKHKLSTLEYELEESYQDHEGFGAKRIERQIEKVETKLSRAKYAYESNKLTLICSKDKYAEFKKEYGTTGFKLSHIETDEDYALVTRTSNIVVASDFGEPDFIMNEEKVVVKIDTKLGADFLDFDDIFLF